MQLRIHVDGGARGNPGPAGAGVVICAQDGPLLFEAGFFLGTQTNNAAEYHALIRALQRANRAAVDSVAIHSDSELLVRQITGEYQVKSPKLAPLFRQVQMLLVRSGRWTIRHVPREENQRADELANLAMDQRRDVIVFDADGTVTPAASAPADSPPIVERVPVSAVPDERPAVRVAVTRAPKAGGCPAGGLAEASFTVGATLPAGLCVHAAHALLPTVLAMLNSDAEEFGAIPTLTVRCPRAECGAEFGVSPVRSSNGGGPRERE